MARGTLSAHTFGCVWDMDAATSVDAYRKDRVMGEAVKRIQQSLA